MGSLNGIMDGFTLKENPIENQRHLKVRVIGAGYSGIYVGIRISQRLRNIDLTIYEKNEGVGGTWWVNKYPGCACDVPSHSYQYSFNPNPSWSSFYAPQKEICAYLQDTATKYGVMRYVKLAHEVVSCGWDDARKKWNLTVKDLRTGETLTDDADVLVCARGALSDPAWPDIPGLKSFNGKLVHSAMWDEGYDYSGKRIGIIGNGSSAIQIVPRLQEMAATNLMCFVRSKTWVTNPFGDISRDQIQEFKTNPKKYFEFRKAIEVDGNTIHAVSLRDSPLQRTVFEIFKANMKRRLEPKPEIAEFLIPSFAVGCRRTTPGPGYLEALVESNVEFVTDRLTEVTPSGVSLKSGRAVELDCLVCATGFNASAPPPFGVHGKDGLSLKKRFAPYPEAYLSLAVDSFPNFFLMLGPNSAIGSGSLTMILESEGDYIIKCIRKLQKENYASMCIKKEAVASWSEYCHTYFKKTVYMDQCNSWYRSERGKGDRITGLWPGSTLHALEALRSPRWEDFEWESLEPGTNPMAWLGNGWSLTHTVGAGGDEYGGDPAWYLEPEFQHVPIEHEPEHDPVYKKRPFSH